ncbi:sulfite reductase [Arcobacter sp. s6]|jgi:sulfite reductase (ferredoxin)|uniref:sulfite reductase n=1 Tax=Arcobacter sp. s6 TaxID=3230363 RepID=UPI0034A07699
MSNNSILNIEQIKKEKSGIDVLADIYIYAIFGEKITPSDLERFKWYGLYAQDEKQEFFELKIPLDMGELNLEQIQTLSQISKDYANNSLNLLNSQKIELKNLKLHNLPNIFNMLHKVELNTSFEAGHTVRRVLTCPVNGIDETQLFDVTDLAKRLNKTFIGNKNFDNLPNKLQMAISGYEEGCDVQFTPDVSFNATRDSKEKIIFAVKIMDRTIGYVTPPQILNTAKAIASIYKDYGDRENPGNNSFEALVKNWGYDKFYDILNASINYKIQKNIFIKNNPVPRKPRMGINNSKIKDESYIGCRFNSNTLESSTFDSLHQLLTKHEASKIKITHKANIIVLDAPSKNANSLAKELEKIGFNPFS